MILPFLFILLIAWIATRVIRRRRHGGRDWHSHDSPMKTLQDRFAKGEIDREEFEHRKAVLEGAEVVPAAPYASPAAPPSPKTEVDAGEEPDDVEDQS